MVVLIMFIRCTAQPFDLDGDGGARTRELVDVLIEEVDLGTLWDEWGIIGDITVRLPHCIGPFPLTGHL
jgi:hypothetical protein